MAKKKRLPFACPTCGETNNWVAHYKVPVCQAVTVLIDPTGGLAEEFFGAPEQSFDPDDTEWFECRGSIERAGNCGTKITWAGTVMPPEGEDAIVNGMPTIYPGLDIDLMRRAAEFMRRASVLGNEIVSFMDRHDAQIRTHQDGK